MEDRSNVEDSDVKSNREEVLAYLRTEFEVSWRHLGGLENKRLWLFVGYCLFVGLLLVAAALAASGQGRSDKLFMLISLALLCVSFACRHIARSERQAAERYRNKINLLRRTLLELLASAELNAMQTEGSANALQTQSNPSKDLRVADLLKRTQWNTALFMKLAYDAGFAAALVGLVALGLGAIAGVS